MRNTLSKFLTIAFVFVVAACSNGAEQKNAPPSAPDTKPQATPSNKFTAADVAKLKWIEGAWQGMNGDDPFFERYRIEETAMVVETLEKDGSVDGPPERFELTNGEFGKGEGEERSAASEITDTSIQFVPAVPGKGNNFRFVKQQHGWDAILEWPATADKPARQKTYRMERWYLPDE